MEKAPIPLNETARLAALRRYRILDTLPEVEYDDITRLASVLCGSSTVLISLVDFNRQWFKSRVGLDVTETARDISFCGHVVASGTMLIIPDATEDIRFCDNPLVTQAPHIRFYAGAPLRTREGLILGTLCLIDYAPKTLSSEQIEHLQSLSRLAMRQLDLRLAAKCSERLAAVVTSSNDAIITQALDGTIDTWNPQAEHLFGYSEQEMINQSLGIVLGPQGWGVEPTLVNAVLRGEALQRLETTFYHRDGEAIAVSVTLSPLRNSNQHIIGTAMIVRDIRKPKLAEQQLQAMHAKLLRSTGLRNEVLTNISHELRTSMSAILGMTQGLQDQVFGPINTIQSRALEAIAQGSQHLLSLIEDIPNLANIESGQMEITVAPTAIASLCRQSMTIVQQQAYAKELQLDLQLSPNLPPVLLDERRIRQVLINLLTNAVKFTPPAGTITLTVHELRPLTPAPAQPDGPDHCLQITVSDTGIGIAPEHRDTILQPFTQLNPKRQQTGLGLGLSIVRGIVESHGGDLQIASELGQGSAFTLTLPVRLATPTPTPPPSMIETLLAAATNKAPLILLVEDNEADIMTLLGYLQAKGYQLRVAKTGLEAIAITQAEPPDIILMDIQLPEMDGLAAMQQIRQNPTLANVPIIALTALAMAGDRDRCLAAGANAYLSKPVRLRHLIATIEGLLAVALS
ncbi:ATP-binding protein [Spirulina major]|uniref:ATP-binding protein n=1 Tax=Spirulina major TaxID=270636 RepID=UPI0009346B01|nr:ATP-binding protein [Spirulina major]